VLAFIDRGLSAASPSSTPMPALCTIMHKGFTIKRNRTQHGATVALLCQGKSEGIRA